MRASGRVRLKRFGVVLTAMIVVAGVGVTGAIKAPRASADPSSSFLDEQFSESGVFPPSNWTAASKDESTGSSLPGTWGYACPAVAPAPATSCFAQAALTSATDVIDSTVSFAPSPNTGIPSNLTDVQLSFYSDWTTNDPNTGDMSDSALSVYQGAPGSESNNRTPIDDTLASDPNGVPTLHTYSLTSDTLPLTFEWHYDPNPATNPSSTWGITDVQITGTVVSNAATLTASATSATVKSGATVSVDLSGTSTAPNDQLSFSVVGHPSLGSLGAVTSTGLDTATVVYTSPASACPDATGNPVLTCPDSFTYEATDASGNTSPTASVTVNVDPGGAGSQLITVSAPGSATYSTLETEQDQQFQGVDLSGAISVGPSDFPDAIELHLLVPTGTLSLPEVAGTGVTFENGTTDSDSQIYLFGSAPDLNQALASLTYVPPSGTTPSTTVSISTQDEGPTGSGPFTTAGEGSATIDITGVSTGPAQPVLALPTGPLAVATNAGPLTFPAGAATGFTVTDAGASTSTDDTVTLTVTAGTLALPAADTSGPSAEVSATSQEGGAILAITGTVANLNLALADLTFDPTNLSSETVTLASLVSDPDDQETSLPGSVPITVTQAPIPLGLSSFTTLENESAVFYLCAGGPTGDSMTFTPTSTPAHGSVVIDLSAPSQGPGCSSSAPSEALLYTPSGGYVGPDSFNYQVIDHTTGLESALTTVSITVAPHTQPTAYALSESTDQATPITFDLCGLNPEQQSTPSLTFTIVDLPDSGTLVDNGPAGVNDDSCDEGNVGESVTYTPVSADFATSGIDVFSYDVSNGAVSPTVEVTISVTSLIPQVTSQAVSVNEDSSVLVKLCATAPDDIFPTYILGTAPHGTVVAYGPADQAGPACPSGTTAFESASYTPNNLYSGPDSFTFYVTEGAYTSGIATISLTVNKVEIPPTVPNQSLVDVAPHSLAVTLAGTSLQGSALTFSVISQPTHGTLTGTAPYLVYTPLVGSGTDSFTYEAYDGTAFSAAGTVSITIATPQLSSTVCVPGTPVNAFLNEYACGATLPTVSNGQGGTIALAHTSGAANGQLVLQGVVTNDSGTPDAVSITANAGSSPWSLDYDIDGSDVTSEVTGSGDVVTLGPVGSPTASIDIAVTIAAPGNVAASPTQDFTITAVSGNDPTVSSADAVEVANGTSGPSLAAASPSGSGAVSYPGTYALSPDLFSGGPSAHVLIEDGITGTGDNTFALHATVPTGASAAVTPTFLLGSQDVTSSIVAGTLDIECYAGIGCPPLTMELSPGPGSGPFQIILRETSTIDGQSALALVSGTTAGSVGPDLSAVSSTGTAVGVGVFEAIPVSQIVSQPVQTNDSATQVVQLVNDGDVTDTFTVGAKATVAAGDSSSLRIGLENGGSTVTDETAPAQAGTYSVVMTPGEMLSLVVSDHAGPTIGLTPATMVVTATSELDSTKVDSFEVTFPTYDYQPDAVLTGPNGQPIGAGVYNSGITIQQAPNPQVGQYEVDQSPTNITVSFYDRGTGPATTEDAVKITAPGSSPNFSATYSLNYLGQTSDVTSAVTGAGLDLSLGQAAAGAPVPVLTMTVAALRNAAIGSVAVFPVVVTSLNSTSAGSSDAVLASIYNDGQSYLDFAGLPQAEPTQITQDAAGDTRVLPVAPPASYNEADTFANYPSTDGSKLVYDSAYDSFSVNVVGETASPTAYRVQMVNALSTSVPQWEQDAFTSPYFSANGLAANGPLETPANPLGASLAATAQANGGNVTSALKAGTYVTPVVAEGHTFDVTMSFSPTSGLIFAPLRFNLYNAATGVLSDSLVIDLTSIVDCSDTVSGQQVISTSTSSGSGETLNFESFNSNPPAGVANECVQQLSHSWISPDPVVFGANDQNDPSGVPGGANPQGLWLDPQENAIIQINTDTLLVTSALAKAYVDAPELDDSGVPLPVTPSTVTNFYYVGTFPNLDWQPSDQSNGLEVESDSTIPDSPFPLETPLLSDFPSSTMGASRYFQIDLGSGSPVMVGEMDVQTSWFTGDVPFHMAMDLTGLTLNYQAPADTTETPPGGSGTTFSRLGYMTETDGIVEQDACVGLPPQLFGLLGVTAQECPVQAIVRYVPASNDLNQVARIASVYFDTVLPAGKLGVPTFNVQSLGGSMTFDLTGAQDVHSVTLNINFGVGPPTPCQLEQNSRVNAVAVFSLQFLADLGCPQNYFFFDAQLTIQDGGYTNASYDSGLGIQFIGTLSFLNILNLASVTVDVSTSPFNISFDAAPTTLVLDLPGIGLSASLVLSGDLSDSGFSIGLAGNISLNNQSIASASGTLSTLGFGICAGLAGLSVGIGELWGSSPSLYTSGCTTSQYAVTS